MSSNHRQYFTSDDLNMLDRVLTQAGLPQSSDPIQRDLRLESTRILIASFQRGLTTERALRGVLDNGLQVSNDHAGEALAAETFPEQFGPAKPPIAGAGYKYGKRIENDGRWTVYHVFSGVPAKFGSWEMIDLNAKTALRALKILNSPEPASQVSSNQKRNTSMHTRTSESFVTFRHTFSIGTALSDLPPGSYRVVKDEELIEGLSYSAYRTTSTSLQVPAMGIQRMTKQYITVTGSDLDAALNADANRTVAISMPGTAEPGSMAERARNFDPPRPNAGD